MTDMCETKDIDGQAVLNEDMLADVSFVSESLSPFFTLEPGSAAVEALYDAFAHLEVGDAADQWPFVEGKDARGPLSAMQKGAARRAALLDEFRRLFVGPQVKAAPQWESVYTDRDGALFGRTTGELRGWLREHGAPVFVERNMPEDHFGCMLAMLSWIARNRPGCLGEFLGQHLLPWAPRFLDRLETETDGDFFRGLAQITHASLEGMRRELRIEARPVRLYS